ncbi:MAG: hypothetical protein K6F39_04705 [Lachnospiraceae bacterium]|nr:hypothetical protein [Lachnospiraceae bacterium]
MNKSVKFLLTLGISALAVMGMMSTKPLETLASVSAVSMDDGEFVPHHYYEESYDDDDDDDDDDDSSSTTSDTSSSDSSSSDAGAASTSDFIKPAATWFTPVCEHGKDVYVVLPIVNMFKYDVKDVVVTPVVSEKTDEFPFEIDVTGFTQKIGTLKGENSEPDRNKRAENCVWIFKTRNTVKSGYYKLNFNVVYTNPVNAIESCTISTYVKTVGLAKYGTTDGTEDSEKKSTPRVIVKGFTTEPATVQAGDNFKLNLTIENTSKKTSVQNMELDLTGTVAGKDESSSYAAFLPTSGANSFYVESIPAGGTAQLSMEFNAKSDLEQKPYVMSIKMQYEDDMANAYEGEASVSIPVHQISKFDTSTPDIQPSSIMVGEQSDVMFSIYNTGKTKLYNVSVTASGDSIEPALAYVGGIESGGTGNVDVMLTGAAPTMDDGTINLVISYEDEAGNATLTEKAINLYVSDVSDEDYSDGGDYTDEADNGMNPTLLKVLIGVGAAVVLLIVVGVILKIKAKRKRKKEEQMLEELLEDDIEKEEKDENK